MSRSPHGDQVNRPITPAEESERPRLASCAKTVIAVRTNLGNLLCASFDFP